MQDDYTASGGDGVGSCVVGGGVCDDGACYGGEATDGGRRFNLQRHCSYHRGFLGSNENYWHETSVACDAVADYCADFVRVCGASRVVFVASASTCYDRPIVNKHIHSLVFSYIETLSHFLLHAI